MNSIRHARLSSLERTSVFEIDFILARRDIMIELDEARFLCQIVNEHAWYAPLVFRFAAI